VAAIAQVAIAARPPAFNITA
jgi:predicted transposase YbfD/YdcC